MVAGVAKICGLDIGKDLPDNCEDPLFSLDVARRALGSPEAAIERIRRNLVDSNLRRQVWGWKFPAAARYLDALKADLINPHFIVVFRDAAAISTRRVARGMDALEAIVRFTEMQKQNVELISDWRAPTLLVSYEKAVSNPEGLVRGLTDFIGTNVAVDMAQVREYTQPGRYKTVPTSAS